METERGAALAELIEQAAGGAAEARGALYEAARAEGIVFALDEALDALARAGVAAEPVADLARRMAAEALHREPLKLAISLLGRAGDERDVELLETVARHDEFSLVAGVALASVLDDPIQAWWRVGCLATGWGRVEAVDRLADIDDELPAEVRGWLLRHACDGRHAGYVAHAFATAGRLERRSAGWWTTSCSTAPARSSAARQRRPGEDIDDYEPGPRVAAAVLDLLADRPPTSCACGPSSTCATGPRTTSSTSRSPSAAGACSAAPRHAGSSPCASSGRTRRCACGASPRRWASTPGRPAGATSSGAGSTPRLYLQLARTPSGDRWARLVGPRRARAAARALAAGPGTPAARAHRTARRRTPSPRSSRGCGPATGRRRWWRPRC